MYTCLTERFLQKIELNCLTDRVRIHEYKRPEWTFHGKGIWVTPPDESTPQLTVIGSSNYGNIYHLILSEKYSFVVS